MPSVSCEPRKRKRSKKRLTLDEIGRLIYSVSVIGFQYQRRVSRPVVTFTLTANGQTSDFPYNLLLKSDRRSCLTQFIRI
jgi:hypothetical protein